MRNWLISIFLFLVIGGCSKSNDVSPDNQQQENAVEDASYFVKYACDGLNNLRYDASYIDTEGQSVVLRNISGDNFERTVGPVKKGFKANFSIKNETTASGAQIAIRIEVKKGSDPFVVRSEAVGYIRNGTSVEYSIE